MLIYINRKAVKGPWGGGSKILGAIIDALSAAGHTVTHELNTNIDTAICFDPRQGNERNLVSYDELYAFTSSRNIPILQRVGDIGTHGKPELTSLVIESCQCSDIVVFPSMWAAIEIENALYECALTFRGKFVVIKNAPMNEFYEHSVIKEKLGESLSFVTHHWSTNDKKGFAFYKTLESWVRDKKHSFTYYGRENGIKSSGIKDSAQLALELPKHDVYVTASIEEAGANHVLEAMACGLPIIYHEAGGSIPEYCSKFGVAFDGTINGFDSAIMKLRNEHSNIVKQLRDYSITVNDVAKDYVKLIEELVNHEQKVN